jgi:AbrB family looped-hinge helix DNA binding protein
LGEVTVTSKGQITIPADIRRRLSIVEGTKLMVIQEGGAVKIIPIVELSKLAGVDKELFIGRDVGKELEEERREDFLAEERRLRN